MNEILLRRLVGACMLILAAFGLTLILPDPKMPVAPEPGLKVVEVGVDDPRPIPSTAAPDEPIQQAEAPSPVPPPPRPMTAQAQASVHRVVTPPPSSLDMATSPDATIEDDDAAGPPNTDSGTPMPDEPIAMAESRPSPVPSTAKPAVVPATKPKPVEPPAANHPQAVTAPPPAKMPPGNPASKPMTSSPPAATTPLPPAVPPKAQAGGRWAVQAGVYADMANARKLDTQIKSLGLSSSISLIESGGGARYRVRVGPFATRDAADAARKRMAQAKIAANVVPDGG